MISFYRVRNSLFRSLGDGKLTKILFYVQFFIKFSCLEFALTQQTFMMFFNA